MDISLSEDTRLSKHFTQAMMLLAMSFFAYTLFRYLKELFFSPLASFPGPRACAISQLPVAYKSWTGQLSHWLKDLHNEYQSDIIRIGPQEVSVTAPSAWNDVYLPRKDRSPFAKNVDHYPDMGNILVAPDPDHRRLRRVMGRAFSEKAMRDQEQHINFHVKRLLQKLRALKEDSVDIADATMRATFDILSDFSFGTASNTQDDSADYSIVPNLIKNLQLILYASVARRFPFFHKLLMLLIPREIIASRYRHIEWSIEKIEQRLKSEPARPDFIAYVHEQNRDLKSQGLAERGLSDEETFDCAMALLAAGVETTAGAVTSVIYFLTTHEEYLQRVVHEIRSSFGSVEQISLRAMGKNLPYLEAVIDESFRRYPPAVTGQPRIVPSPAMTVAGHYIPSGTTIHMNQYAINHFAGNFTRPDDFMPERWLETETMAGKRDAIQPFGVGSRNCVGKSLALAIIRLLLANLLFSFDMAVAEKTDLDWLCQEARFIWVKKPLLVGLRAR